MYRLPSEWEQKGGRKSPLTTTSPSMIRRTRRHAGCPLSCHCTYETNICKKRWIKAKNRTWMLSPRIQKQLESGYLKSSLQFWLWSLIILMIQRSLFSAVFIPHEDFTPQTNVHSSTWGSAGGLPPLRGPTELFPWLGGLGASRGSAEKPPKEKISCKCIL
jgi:hypothetical protein